jgi:hypothetical protein
VASVWVVARAVVESTILISCSYREGLLAPPN